MANKAAIMKELGKMDPKRAAAKLAKTVGPLLDELDPKKLREGNLVEWRENLNAAWSGLSAFCGSRVYECMCC